MTETLQETMLVPLVRTVFGYTDKPTLTDLVDHLDGLNYIVELIPVSVADMSEAERGVFVDAFLSSRQWLPKIAFEVPKVMGFIIETHLDLQLYRSLLSGSLPEVPDLEDEPAPETRRVIRVPGPARWRVLSISTNSPMELIIGLASAVGGVTLVLTVAANRVVSVFKNWHKMKQEQAEADLGAARARQANAEADKAETEARLQEAAADYLVKELDIKPLELDARRLAHAVAALEAVSTIELLAEPAGH